MEMVTLRCIAILQISLHKSKAAWVYANWVFARYILDQSIVVAAVMQRAQSENVARHIQDHLASLILLWLAGHRKYELKIGWA